MKQWKEEKGIALIWLALTLVLLIGMAGFATDLGWLYLNTTRAQKAVDSAALAGVVNLPGFIAQATIDAEDATVANGFDPDGLTVTPLADNKLHAELRAEVPSIFMKVLGFDHFNVTRQATAEYIKPVPLGNPDNCFGCPSNGSSWAAISSQFIHKEHGDPYSTRCRVPNSNGTSCQSTNTDFNRGGAYAGYYYGIEVFSGSSNLDVDLYDPGFFARPQDQGTGDFNIGNGPEPTTNFTLHMVDTTPLDPTDNPVICSRSYGPDEGPQDDWDDLCGPDDVSGSLIPGIYVLHVTTSGQGIASNHYSVMANVGLGATPRVFGINDMSIWSNTVTSSTELYIAEIEDIHAGKKLELQFYDPGDADDNSWMSVISPTGEVPICDWTVWNHNLTAETQQAHFDEPCEWQTTDTSRGSDPRVYNEQWIVAVIDLPDDPADMCGADCFWKMELDLSLPTERTTWRARVIGNPVRLIPDAP